MTKEIGRLWAIVALAALVAAGPAWAQTAGLPMRPARHIEFDTDEGTWLSLAVSPRDGTIVFDMLGDLYAVGAAGGPARALTRGMAFDSQPVFSPDGSELAFISDRSGAENLWVAKPDGSDPRQITNNVTPNEFVSPSFSPDGRYLYASLYQPVTTTPPSCGASPSMAGRPTRYSAERRPRNHSTPPAQRRPAAHPRSRSGGDQRAQGRALARWPLRLLRRSRGAAVRGRRHLAAVGHRANGPHHPRPGNHSHQPGERHAAGALAGRQVAGLRRADGGRDGAARAHPRWRLRPRAHRPGPARRPGSPANPRPCADLRLLGRRQVPLRRHRRSHRGGGQPATRWPGPRSSRSRPMWPWISDPFCARTSARPPGR